MASNDLGGWTRPAPGLYPHQWFWDSCFVAIGLAHVDPDRAARELLSLMHGQWENGMMPHMIYSSKWPYRLESWLWGTGGLSPRTSKTSGITQPPMLAIAAERVARALPPREATIFIQTILPTIIRFHEWIYRERDPQGTGLAAVLHSWECGMDDIPYWTEAMKHLPPTPLRWRWLREYRPVRPSERATPQDLQHMLALAYLLKSNHFDSASVMRQSKVVLADLLFNSVLAAANESLERLAETIDQPVPPELRARFAPTRRALERLWDPELGQYFTRNYHTGRLLRTPTVATFMPLFAGTAAPSRAETLRKMLTENRGYNNVPFPLPSVPRGSRHFEPQRYWRGPTWISLNWFVVLGLERYGFTEEAEWLRLHTVGLVERSGFREYYNPLTGDGLGAAEFSWSAALTLDLLAGRPDRELDYEQ